MLKEPKRILHIFGQMERGGAESRTMDIYRNINREIVQFDFIVMKPGEHAFFQEIKNLGGRIFYIDPPAKRGFLFHAHQMYKVLKDNGPFHAIHAHTAFNEGLAVTVARIAGLKIRISHSRSASEMDEDNLLKKFYRIIMRILILNNSTHLVTCGTEAGIYLFGKKSMDNGEVNFVPNAIDLTSFEIMDDKRSEIKNELKIPENSIVLGTVGNLREVKNHTFLLDVFEYFNSRQPNSYLVIVGDGPLLKDLTKKAERLGIDKQVKFLGRRDDVPIVLQAFDIFMLPSFYEGVPGSVIEAHAAGVKCVLSDAITRDIDFGLNMIKYVSLEADNEEWYEATNNLLESEIHPKSIIFDRLREYGYDIESSCEKIMKIYGFNKQFTHQD